MSSPTVDKIILKKEVDIERGVTTIVDTLILDEKGAFEVSFTDEPYLYSLNFPNKKKIDIALNSGQRLKLQITGYDTDNFKAIAQGSLDTEQLLAYEAFRKASLTRLVKSVRNEIKELKKAEVPDTEKIAMLGRLELSNYDKHLDELVEYIQKNMTSTLGLYATSIRWKGAHQLATFDTLVNQFEVTHGDLAIVNKLNEKVRRFKANSHWRYSCSY